jgi:hypothetical protein
MNQHNESHKYSVNTQQFLLVKMATYFSPLSEPSLGHTTTHEIINNCKILIEGFFFRNVSYANVYAYTLYMRQSVCYKECLLSTKNLCI